MNRSYSHSILMWPRNWKLKQLLTVGTQDFAIRGFVIGSEYEARSDWLFCSIEVVTRKFCREKKKVGNAMEEPFYWALGQAFLDGFHNQKIFQKNPLGSGNESLFCAKEEVAQLIWTYFNIFNISISSLYITYSWALSRSIYIYRYTNRYSLLLKETYQLKNGLSQF